MVLCRSIVRDFIKIAATKETEEEIGGLQTKSPQSRENEAKGPRRNK
jgi:hypothetical protein